LAALLSATAAPALADGAFPNESYIFVPTDQPSDIVVIATFGLIVSTNGGASWSYVCNPNDCSACPINLYQMGPTGTLLSDYPSGLSRSPDLGCSWAPAGGTLAGPYVWDAAFDPENPGAVLAFSHPADAGSASAIFPSSDDAVTFGPPLYVTPAVLNGIEFSVSSPGLVYVVGNEPLSDGGGGTAFVLVGADGGASWGTPIDHPELNAELAGDAGPDGGPPPPPLITLAQVDPVDSQTVYLQLTVASGQTWLAVSHDGGKTLQLLFLPRDPMSAFLRSSEDILYVGTLNDAGQGGIFEAPLDGGPFQVVHQACADGGVPADGSCDLHVRAIAERDGLLYVSAFNWAPDDMALGTSTDHGVHFTSVMQFVDMSGLGCAGTLEATCGALWCGSDGLVEILGIDGGGCPSTDAGTTTPTGSGCNCGTAGDGATLLGLLALAAIRRRRRVG
jgi:MYXO-CTERM domain-containing protein